MNKVFKIGLIVLLLLIIALKQGKLAGTVFPFPDETEKKELVLPELTLSDVKKFFPEAAMVEVADTSVFIVLDKSKQELGRILFSSPYSDKIIGFAGPVPLFIVLNASDNVISVSLLENSETPQYLDRIVKEGLLTEWIGLSKEEAIQKKVDAVSGATFTSDAIIRSVQQRLAIASLSVKHSEISWNLILKNIIVLFILALALYSFFYPARTKKVRFFLLLFSVALLGFWQGSMLSLSLFLSWLINGIPLGIQLGLFLVLLAAVLCPLFTGRSFYCSFVCPFGAAQELVGKIDRNKWKISPFIFRSLLVLRKAFLIAIVLLLVFGVNFDLSYIEPFSAFNISAASMITIGIAMISLFLSLFINRPWCRFLCPVGQILDSLRK